SKAEVHLSKEELDCEVYNAADYVAKLGDQIELLVVGLNPLRLSQKMIKVLQQEEALGAEIEGGKEFSVVCTGSNKGGLTAQFGTYSVFVPAKEIRPGFVKDFAKYEGKTLRLRALEIKKNGSKREIIASQRVILQEERDARDAARLERENEFFANIQVGDVVTGKVERATSFGAFVSVNGFDCLAHISDLSWTGAANVTDVLEIGKVYEFLVLKIDAENKKVSIGYKQLQPQPWDLADGKYNVGDVVHGKVVRIVPFGAFVEVEKGIDGLVHVSQITHERIETPATALNVGDEVDAKIIAIDIEARKMNLSIKALLPEGEKRKHSEEDGEDNASGKKRAPRRSVANDDELSTWSEGSIGGTSIADLLASAKKDN
ncbi:MAG: S1 RNA-binding domain-containing protein, partial [Clostridia bacterium]|nr:S1 RNA-binding domain-containing protein [Clostridia bacterium]